MDSATREAVLDVFDLCDGIVDQYGSDDRSFLMLRNSDTRRFVHRRLHEGPLWPEPQLQLRPSLKPGRVLDQLVSEGVLDEPCSAIFQRGKTPNQAGMPLQLHQHHKDEIRATAHGRQFRSVGRDRSGRIPSLLHTYAGLGLLDRGKKGVKAIAVYGFPGN